MNQLNSQANRAATAARPTIKPTAKPTILRRLLSHHELATLLLLLHAPIDVNAKPEIPMLQEAGLVEQVTADSGTQRFQLTPQGNAILRGLGAA
jgi:hypothetical protein